MARYNPRRSNGNLRNKLRQRLKAQGNECGICHGRLGPIHYDEPSDSKHPLSFVVDEIIPVSKWQACGYDSPEAAAKDWNNLQAAHWCCNAAKGNKINFNIGDIDNNKDSATTSQKPIRANIIDGEW